MTWDEWIDSKYNTKGVYYESRLSLAYGKTYIGVIVRPGGVCLQVPLQKNYGGYGEVCADWIIGEMPLTNYGWDGTYVW